MGVERAYSCRLGRNPGAGETDASRSVEVEVGAAMKQFHFEVEGAAVEDQIRSELHLQLHISLSVMLSPDRPSSVEVEDQTRSELRLQMHISLSAMLSPDRPSAVEEWPPHEGMAEAEEIEALACWSR